MSVRREVAWLVTALLFGTLALPMLAYYTGLELLGPYVKGGLGAFLADFATALARLRWYSWAMALGPLAVASLWRLLWGLASRNRED